MKFTHSGRGIAGILQQTANLTFTNQQLVVVDEANGALAPEAANHIDAHPVFTDSWNFPALIDICERSKRQGAT